MLSHVNVKTVKSSSVAVLGLRLHCTDVPATVMATPQALVTLVRENLEVVGLPVRIHLHLHLHEIDVYDYA